MERETVFVLRDVEERYLQGIYRHHLDALDAIEDLIKGQRADDDGEEELEYLRDQFEILEMPLE